MTVRIKSVGVELPGRVTRSYDDITEMTTLVLDEVQVVAIHDQLATVMQFFNSQHEDGSVKAK